MKFLALFCVLATLAISQAATIPEHKENYVSSDESVLRTLKEANNLLRKGKLAPLERSRRQVESSTTTKRPPINYDVEIDKVLSNERLVNHYYRCLVDDKYRCRGDGLKLKKRLPQYLRQGLEKDFEKDFDSKEARKECNENTCSEEKAALKKLTRYFIEEKPEMWRKVEAKYDPTGSYKKRYYQKYGAEIKANGVTIPNEFIADIVTTGKTPTPLAKKSGSRN